MLEIFVLLSRYCTAVFSYFFTQAWECAFVKTAQTSVRIILGFEVCHEWRKIIERTKSSAVKQLWATNILRY